MLNYQRERERDFMFEDNVVKGECFQCFLFKKVNSVKKGIKFSSNEFCLNTVEFIHFGT